MCNLIKLIVIYLCSYRVFPMEFYVIIIIIIIIFYVTGQRQCFTVENSLSFNIISALCRFNFQVFNKIVNLLIVYVVFR